MYDLNAWAFANGAPECSAELKRSPEDFKVNELLGYELTNEGEHEYLLIEKTGINTEEVIKEIARLTELPEKLISYAGLKDRHAITTQWVSLHCPGQTLDLSRIQGKNWHVIKHQRHLKKLKKGGLKGNQFQITLRDINKHSLIEDRLELIKYHGVPNYFGEQRFGFAGQNLEKAKRVLLDNYKIKDRFLRGMYYSAARSFLFNLILSERVRLAVWNKAVVGDVMQLSGSNSIFSISSVDASIEQRINEFDISPAAPLWGIGEEKASEKALTIQQDALNTYKNWCDSLEKQKLERAYRPLILVPDNFSWEWLDNALLLNFNLPSGGYATSVIRELVVNRL